MNSNDFFPLDVKDSLFICLQNSLLDKVYLSLYASVTSTTQSPTLLLTRMSS